jgi:penicillin-binding protein 1B
MAGVGLMGLVAFSAVELARFEAADARRATFVYAAGQPLFPGVSVRAVDLAGTLGRLKYVEVRSAPTAPGQFRRTAGGWDIHLRGSDPSLGPGGAERLRVELRGDRVSRVLRDGEPVLDAALEGEVLTSVGDRPGEDIRPVRLGEVPIALLNAVLAAEDHRFFEHRGLDVRGVMRAAWANLRAGRVRQGGSTITQQLVKNRLLTPRRTFTRKVTEAWLATLIDWRYPKERILESYLNEIYLGQRGPIAIRGVGAAARALFRKEIHQLTLGESAMLAGMIRAPNTTSPLLNPARARERRDTVLARMRELGTIGDGDLRAAVAETIRVHPSAAPGQLAPYFTDLVRQEVEQTFGSEVSQVRDSRVHTTLDVALQRFAEAAVVRGLDRLESRLPRLRRSEPGERLQGALVALDPATGQVKALVGGRDYQASQFNRALLGRRQPGSAFKPFVYATALIGRGGHPVLTAASLVEDTPLTRVVDRKTWSPRNYEDRYEGRVTVRRALEASLNAATVRIAETVGLPAVIETAHTLGFAGDLQPVPALALGVFEATPLELARAYLAFANGGVRPGAPSAVRVVLGPDGVAATPAHEAGVRVLSPAEAYLLTSLLEGVVRSGTGAPARAQGLTASVAGKTGTTNDARDAWFVGYSSNLVAVVWVGFDQGDAHGLSGGEAALPIWADFMKQALDAYPAGPFTVPAGIVQADVDRTNGRRANRFCPLDAVAREVFLAGSEPPECTDHGGAADHLRDWWNRFRGWWGR